VYVCTRVFVSFGRNKSECGGGSLKREFFHGGADAADKEIVGCAADEGAHNGHQAAYGGLAQAEEEFFGDIFEQATGGDQACFESDGNGDDCHESFKTHGIGATAGINDGQCHAELLGDVIEEIEGQSQDHGGSSADAGDSPGGSGDAGAMLDITVETELVYAFFDAILVDAIEDLPETR
jgi:hypothetical protein